MWRSSPSKAACVYLRTGLALALSAGAIALATLAFTSADSKSPQTGLMAPSLAGAAKLPAALPVDLPLTLTVVLNRADQVGFEKSLRAMQDPNSPLYRQYLSPREQADRFGPSISSYNAVNDWLEQQGFKLIEGSENRLTLTLSGTRGRAEKAFGVQIDNYRVGGRIFYANDREPILPVELAPHIQAVIGLSNRAEPRPSTLADQAVRSICLTPAQESAIYDRMYQFCLSRASVRLYGPSICDDLYEQAVEREYKYCLDNYASGGYGTGSGNLLAQAVSPRPPLLPAPPFAPEVTGSPRLPSVDGSGQTVGLLEFDTFNKNDIRDYLAFAGRPPTQINRLSEVHVNGGASLGREEAEVLLDIVAVMTNAPGANVVVYDAPFSSIRTSFQTLFNRMIGDGVSIISNSWVYCEDQASAADVQSIDSILASAAAAGISVLNSTGDFGSTCINGSSNVASIPASCPHGTAVGGTSLTLGPRYTYGSELFWNGLTQSPPTGAGGFGVSRFFSRPAYQNGFTTSPMRSVPDLSINADPAKGIEICQADAGGCPTGATYGGTSLAAPLWAAFVALLNQGQGQNLGELNPLLYPLGNTDAFHSAARMGSDFQHVGLGSPNVDRIHLALTGKTPGAVSPTVSQIAAEPAGAVADGNSQVFVVVRLRDANGHSVSGKTVSLAGNSGSHATITPAGGVSNVDNGAVIFSVTDATQELVTMTASDTTDGVVLQTQLDVFFIDRPAAAGGIAASKTTVTANGSDTTTITVTLQDAKGNPSPNKVINLSQGNGASIISATTAKTDATGKAQFTAVSYSAETVTYTAVDVTDRSLPVPGSAAVSFVNSSGSCARNFTGVASPGYAVTTFASNFPFDCFSGVAPFGVAFDTKGNLFVSDIVNNSIYTFGPHGGIAGPATFVGTIPSSFGAGPVGLAFTKDGKFYVGLRFGAKILEMDPATGDVIRVVASMPEDPLDLRVDPLSGDLFVSTFGAIHRITNFANGPGTVTPYVNGGAFDGFEFASDGTIYFKAGSTGIFRATGTNTPNPGTFTQIAFVDGGPDGIAIEPNPANPSKPFLYVNRNDGIVTRIDMGAAPANVFSCSDAGAPCTNIYTGGSRGDLAAVGPTGCLFATQSDRVIKLTNADGTCSLSPSNPAPQLVLTPENVQPSPAQGTAVTFTASLKNVANPADVPITLFVNGGNAVTRLVRSGVNGNATITYTGAFAGADEAFATADLGASLLLSNTANVNWTNGKHTTFLTLNQSPGSGAPNKSIKLKASLVDVSVSPAAPIPNAAVNFNLAGQSCNGVTDANGDVVCSVTPIVAAGQYDVTANFAGTTQFLASSARKRFDLIVPPPHQLLNISTRMQVLTGDKVLIGGFIVTGSEPKKVIVRGMGPSLGGLGLQDPLQDPILELHPANGPTITNDNWKETQRSEIEASGIPPGDDREAAIVATLPPGNHTAILSGKGGENGAGLVEVYDLSQPADAKLANISTRGFVDTDDNVMIAGFIAGPPDGTLVQVLVRGIGPSLSGAGVPDALQDPMLELHDSNGSTLAANDNWTDTQQTDIEGTGIPPEDEREAAILSPLAPGNYTAILRGKDASTGIGLVEVYNVQ